MCQNKDDVTVSRHIVFREIPILFGSSLHALPTFTIGLHRDWSLTNLIALMMAWFRWSHAVLPRVTKRGP